MRFLEEASSNAYVSRILALGESGKWGLAEFRGRQVLPSWILS